MKSVFLYFTLMIANFLGGYSFANDSHHHHVKHNMVLFGEKEIFASHIVYKVPHNYQVILKISLPIEIKEKYLSARANHSEDQFIFLLDEMNIREIAARTSISGTIFRTNLSGERHTIANRVKLVRDDFAIVYFDELPLSLE